MLGKFINAIKRLPEIASREGIYFTKDGKRTGLYVVTGLSKAFNKIWDSEDYKTKVDTDEALGEKANQTQVNDIAASVDVLTVEKADKDVVDALMNGIIKQPSVDTYNDTSDGKKSLASVYGLTSSSNGTNEVPKQQGWDVLVLNDETKGNISNRYNWNGTIWVDMDTGLYDETVIDNLNAKAQTYLFGKSTTFGLQDKTHIDIIKNSIRDIYITDKSIKTDSLAVLSFGKNEQNNIFYFDIADMTGKKDNDFVTDSERTIRCEIPTANIPASGIHRFNLKLFTIKTVIGWVEIDFSLYFSNPIYLASSNKKTLIQAKINFNDKLNYKLDTSSVKEVSSIPIDTQEVPSHSSVFNELFKADTNSIVYDGSVEDNSINGYISTSSGNYTGKTTGTLGFKHIVVDVNAGDTIVVSGRSKMRETQGYDYIHFLSNYNFVDGSHADVISMVKGDGSYIVPSGAKVAFIWVKSTTADDTKTVKVEISSKGGVLPRLSKLESSSGNSKCYVKNNVGNIQVYLMSKSDSTKYYMFQITHEIDNSEIVYKNLWRITAGGLYKLNNGIFTSLNISLVTSGENEFAMKFRNKADYTGGTHGDERIDTEGSFILFNVDGLPLTSEKLANTFLMECSSFDYVQYSTLHETTGNGTTPIEGHPIVARHLKRTFFADEGYVNYNMVKIEVQSYLDQYHSGLYCTHKDTASRAFLSDPRIVELTGSDNSFQSNNTNSLISFWNNDKKMSVDITSRFISGLDDSIVKPKVLDRSADSKYYRRLENMNMLVEEGHIIENEMTISYK